MTRPLRDNIKGGDSCPFCADSGWVYLNRYRDIRSNGTEYKEQIIAGCGYCTCGHKHFERYGGAWNYRVDEIDVNLSEDEQRQLTPDEKGRWLQVLALREEMRRKGNVLSLHGPSQTVRLVQDQSAQLSTTSNPNEE